METPAVVSPIARFVDKVFVSTASTNGIGLATAERLGREGAKVIISSRKQDKVDKAVQHLKQMNIEVSGIVCHQGKRSDRERLIDHVIAPKLECKLVSHFGSLAHIQALQRYGRIDHLFLNAGVNPHTGDILKITEKEWDKTFDVNLTSLFLMIKECVPHMTKSGGASIVTMSTAGAYILGTCPANIVSSYVISKLGQSSLAKVLARSLAEMNIRLNVVAPGPIETPFFANKENIANPNDKWPLSLGQLEHKRANGGMSYCTIGAVPFPEGGDSLEQLMPYVPLKRTGQPEEVAGVIAFLLSKDASFITGDTVTVCGGINSRL